MLTRELLLFRTRDAKLRPTFVKRGDPALLALAAELIALVEAGCGQTRDDVEDALALRAGAHTRPKVARGLVKLLVDRMRFEEPAAEASQARAEAFQAAARVRLALPPQASMADYEARLAEAFPQPLAALREGLYADLPGQRVQIGRAHV